MDSSSGWAMTSSTFRLLLSPRSGDRKCGLGGRQDAGEDRIRPREIAHRSTAPAAGSIQIHDMELTPVAGAPLIEQVNLSVVAGGGGNCNNT